MGPTLGFVAHSPQIGPLGPRVVRKDRHGQEAEAVATLAGAREVLERIGEGYRGVSGRVD